MSKVLSSSSNAVRVKRGRNLQCRTDLSQFVANDIKLTFFT